MKMRRKELIKSGNEISSKVYTFTQRLRIMAHLNDGTCNPYVCPRECGKHSENELGLHTALTWLLAEVIEEIIDQALCALLHESRAKLRLVHDAQAQMEVLLRMNKLHRQFSSHEVNQILEQIGLIDFVAHVEEFFGYSP